MMWKRLAPIAAPLALVAATAPVSATTPTPAADGAAAAAGDTCWSYKTVKKSRGTSVAQAKLQIRSCLSGRKYARVQICNLKPSGKTKNDAEIHIERKKGGGKGWVSAMFVRKKWPTAGRCTSTGGFRVWRYRSYRAKLTWWYDSGSMPKKDATYTRWWYYR